jgi:hypothetical protein
LTTSRTSTNGRSRAATHLWLDGKAVRCRQPCALRRLGRIPEGALFELGARRGPVGLRNRQAEFCVACLRRALQGAEALRAFETMRSTRHHRGRGAYAAQSFSRPCQEAAKRSVPRRHEISVRTNHYRCRRHRFPVREWHFRTFLSEFLCIFLAVATRWRRSGKRLNATRLPWSMGCAARAKRHLPPPTPKNTAAIIAPHGGSGGANRLHRARRSRRARRATQLDKTCAVCAAMLATKHPEPAARALHRSAFASELYLSEDKIIRTRHRAR